MNYEIVLFDLDGTLTDPKIGITNSVQYALNCFGIEVADINELCSFIGPPLRDSFIKYYGFTKADAETAVVKYWEYFSEKGLFENKVYNGIAELLQDLKASHKKVMVATSKPEIFAKKILKHFKMDLLFDFIGGGTLDGSREEKADVIRYVMNENHLSDQNQIIMVGDRKYDIVGARKNNLQSIGVLYGYGDRTELETAEADFVVSTVEELYQLLL